MTDEKHPSTRGRDPAAESPPSAQRRRITLLRHAEKEGREQPALLSSTGRMRAFALPWILQAVAQADGFHAVPDCLIAAQDRPDSRRPSQTLRHLAARLGLDVQQCDGAGEVRARLFDTSNDPEWRHAVVAWRHDSLIDLARRLGALPADLPGDWPDSLYDRFILLDVDAKQRVIRTRCLDADALLDLAEA